MPTQPLQQSASGTASASGTVTLTFSGVPSGLVWSGTYSVPTSDAGATWTAYLNSATGIRLQSWVGKTVGGPISLQAGDSLVIVGTGLTVNSAQQAIFLGRSDEDMLNPFLFPDPLISSLSLNQLQTGTLIVGPAGDRIIIAPTNDPLSPIRTQELFDTGLDESGFIRGGKTVDVYGTRSLQLQSPRNTGENDADIVLVSGATISQIVLDASSIQLAATQAVSINSIAYLEYPGATSETATGSSTRASAAYGDLAAGVDPEVSLLTGTRVLILLHAWMSNTGAGNNSYMSVAVSGSTTVAASDNFAALITSATAGNGGSGCRAFFMTGLTAGSNTFTAKYRCTAGTMTALQRDLTVIPL